MKSLNGSVILSNENLKKLKYFHDQLLNSVILSNENLKKIRYFHD